ncbi:MAG: ABC transporter ATP-binding protein [Clostridiales bacterium]|nr:ABC transporter ATP-binding protein [Clostridiales bacterium]
MLFFFVNAYWPGYGIAVTQVLYIIGLFVVLKRCQVNPYWALIPGFREYHLSRCCDREHEGRVFFVLCILSLVSELYLIINSAKDGSGEVKTISVVTAFFLMLVMFAAVGEFVYTIRIFAGLCDLFGYSKKYLWFYFLFGREVMLWILGFGNASPKFIYLENTNGEGAKLSGMEAETLESGLTVNIEERTVSEFFKKRQLLRDIHLNIEPGRMVLLLGGSGAGKTTFLNAVNGYEKADAKITLNGIDLYEEYAKMKYNIGFVPQMDLMRVKDSVELTVEDAAKLRLPTFMNAKQREERIDEVLSFFGLMPVKKSLCSKLSGGQRKRLSIAMEYISNPDLFILDEPDSGLDGVMARELMQGLRKVADQGKIVIVITHSPDRVADLFDDVIVLAKDSKLTGRLAYYGSIEKALDFFNTDSMEKIVLRINREEEGGEGFADMFIEKYAEVCHV